MSIKVLIADDHQIMREGLRAMLEKEHDIKVVGEAEDGRMMERLARELAPGCDHHGRGDARFKRHRGHPADCRRIARGQDHRPLHA